MAHNAELLVGAKALVGEGPIWDVREQKLIWVDIAGKKLHFFDPASGNDHVIELEQMPGTVVLRKSGGLMLAVENGFAAFDPATAKLDIWSDPEADKPQNRFNDGKCDPAGRFWAGTMPYDASKPSGSLYCLEPSRTVRHMFDGVSCSNGIAWSGDAKTMYYIDTMTRGIDAFDFDLTHGEIRNRRKIVTIPEEAGFPDGMTIDTENNLWVGHWGGARVSCWDPHSGKELERIELPVSQVTACWFGGANLDELYITTAREGMDASALAEQPLAGGLFRAKPGPRGREAAAYGG